MNAPFRLLFVLLHCSVSIKLEPLGWEQCSSESQRTVCLISEGCLRGQHRFLVHFHGEIDALNNGECTNGLILQASEGLGSRQTRVRLMGEHYQSPIDSIRISDGTVNYVECSYDKGKITTTSSIKRLKISDIPANSKIGSHSLVCEFVIEEEIIGGSSNSDLFGGRIPILEYSTPFEKYSFRTKTRVPADHCDSTQLVLNATIPQINGFVLTKPKAEFRNLLNCNSDHKKLFLQIGSISAVIEASLACNTRNSKYVATEQSGKLITISSNITINVFCGVKDCNACGDITSLAKPDNLPFQSFNAKSGCIYVKCPQVFRYNDVEYSMDPPVCIDQRWRYRVSGSAAYETVSSIGCIKSVDCLQLGKVVVICPAGVNCGQVIKSHSRVYCKDPTHNLSSVQPCIIQFAFCFRVQYPKREKSFIVSEINCNPENGRWHTIYDDDKKLQFPKRMEVHCAGPRDVIDHSQPLSTGVLVITISTISITLLFLIGGIILCIYQKMKRSQCPLSILQKRPEIEGPISNRACKKRLDSLQDWDELLHLRIIETWYIYSVYEKSIFIQRCADKMDNRVVTTSAIMRLIDCVFTKDSHYKVFESLLTLVSICLEIFDNGTLVDEVLKLRQFIKNHCETLLQSYGLNPIENEDPLNANLRVTLLHFLIITDDDLSIRRLLGYYDSQKFAVQSPFQLAVWITAVRCRNNFDEIYGELERAMIGEVPIEKDAKFGTRRENLIKALCASRDQTRLKKFIEEICKVYVKPVASLSLETPTSTTSQDIVFSISEAVIVFNALANYPEGRRVAIEILLEEPVWLQKKLPMNETTFLDIFHLIASFIIDMTDFRKLEDMVFCEEKFNEKRFLSRVDFRTMTKRIENRQEMKRNGNLELTAWFRNRDPISSRQLSMNTAGEQELAEITPQIEK